MSRDITIHAPLVIEGFGGVKLAAQVWGLEEDPAVVLLHGADETRDDWTGVAEALAAAGRYVLAYDRRGHGDSARPADGRYDLSAHVNDLRCVLGQLNRRPVILGASTGGVIALTAAGEGGELQASGLILADPSPWMESAGVDEVDGLLAGGSAPRFKAAAALVKLPTLVLHIAGNGAISTDVARRLQGLIAEAELADIPAAGGLIAEDQLDAFNAAVLDFLERRAPRAPLVYRQGSDARVLRDALGCFSTGVTVITARKPDGALVGFTANSFTSVSLDPPLILICLAKTSTNAELFATRPDFGVHVLHIGQQQISAQFARSGADKFTGVAWETWETGAPIIQGSLAALECSHYATHDAGDHTIIVGRVRRAHYEPHRDPLLFFRGRYRRLHFQ
jgi:flavin reductase (DIM6/NTAB) family NADH-FMN oxidoreductase RutF/pimeloyl-ACP methyl ester carboxylesterase